MLTKEEFAEKLKQAIDETGITQAELAKNVGTSPANISNYAKAKAFPPVDVLVELAKALEKPLDWMCNRDEGIHNPANIDTVGAAARIIETLETWDTIRTTDVGYEYYGDTVCFPAIEFRGGELQKFLEDKRKMEKVLEDGTIDQELFDRWKQDRLSALDRIPASSQHFQKLDDFPELENEELLH